MTNQITYGNCTFSKDDIKVQTTAGSLHPNKDRVVLWGHTLRLDGDTSLECSTCDMSVEMPDLMTKTAGFREAAYRMYLLGKFKQADCEAQTFDPEDLTTVPSSGNGNDTLRYDPSKVHWSVAPGTHIKTDFGTYKFRSDGTVVNTDNGSEMTKDQFLKAYQRKEIEKAKKKASSRIQRPKPLTEIGGPNANIGGHNDLTGSTGSTFTVGTDDLTSEEKATFKEKLAKKLQGRNPLTR